MKRLQQILKMVILNILVNIESVNIYLYFYETKIDRYDRQATMIPQTLCGLLYEYFVQGYCDFQELSVR